MGNAIWIYKYVYVVCFIVICLYALLLKRKSYISKEERENKDFSTFNINV